MTRDELNAELHNLTNLFEARVKLLLMCKRESHEHRLEALKLINRMQDLISKVAESEPH